MKWFENKGKEFKNSSNFKKSDVAGDLGEVLSFKI